MKNAVISIRTTHASTTITTTARRNIRTKCVSKQISLILQIVEMVAVAQLVEMVAAVAMVSLLSEDQRAPILIPTNSMIFSRLVSALWEDKTISKISVPYSVMQSNNSDIIQDVAETICYSRLTEAYMVDNFMESDFKYFGARNGLFRMTPAQGRKICGSYDPRTRPWFVAAASGPKDVVLVIDGTNSNGALNVTRDAAIAVIGTLNVNDRFTVIAFTNEVYVLLGGSTFIPATGLNINDLGLNINDLILLRATSVNQSNAIEAISNLMADGRFDIYTAFETAFDAISNTLDEGETSDGPIAILFLSDDQNSETVDTEQILGLIDDRTLEFENRPVSRNVTIFTYSLGEDSDHDLLKRIACNTGGIYASVKNEDLVAEMSSYYELFALGLDRKGVATWAEPYTFFSRDVVGTTVSVPVYRIFPAMCTSNMFVFDTIQ